MFDSSQIVRTRECPILLNVNVMKCLKEIKFYGEFIADLQFTLINLQWDCNGHRLLLPPLPSTLTASIWPPTLPTRTSSPSGKPGRIYIRSFIWET